MTANKDLDETARLLKRRPFDEVKKKMNELAVKQQSGQISPYEIAEQAINLIVDSHWTIDEYKRCEGR